jgi:hypothetical protein
MKYISKYLHSTIHKATTIHASDTKQEIKITVHYKKNKGNTIQSVKRGK